ncbi:MAG: hypothetical protein ACYCWN_09210 [Ferrimicrobium sp.]|uniref:Uncharacterized protein n=1 Tax=Ferrimicrobium acidiphilum TaxID=121039 RepID=A0ABV3Y1X2_9ACTN|nr:hypothetical protein [Ferrimicrobium sp.]
MSQLSASPLLRMTPYQPSTLFPIKAEFAALMLRGGLVAGAIALVSGTGSYTVMIEMLSVTSRAGFAIAFVGLHDLGVVALTQSGWDLTQVVLVDDGPEMSQAIAVLLAAFDVVVFDITVIDRHWHRLVARARERKSALVVIDQDCRRSPRQLAPDVTLIVEEFGWAQPTAECPFGAPAFHVAVQEHGFRTDTPTVLAR